jgi:thiamine-phosphate pyrophosphorylase
MYELKCKNYVFDLDGTLLDSMPPAVKIVLDYLDEHGVAYEPSIVKILTPLGFRGISIYYATELGIPRTPDEIYAAFSERLSKAYANEMPLKSGVIEALKGLKTQGARLCVLTASPHEFTDICLKNRGIYELFDYVWTAEDFGTLKSDVRIYWDVAKRLGTDVSACAMVDDSLRVLKTAKSAGMRTIGVYEPFSDDEWAEIEKTADFCVRRLDELIEK